MSQWGTVVPPSHVHADDVRRALDAIQGSREFARSKRLNALLAFIVEETLNGRGKRLTLHSIAEAVYGCGAGNDPERRARVPVESHRLIRKLQHYNAVEGKNADIAIDMARGSYVPSFRRRVSPKPKPAVEPPPPPYRIAVLPFAIDDEPDCFCEELAADLILYIGREPGIDVLPFSEARHVSRTALDRDTSHGVRCIVSGIVARSGERLRIAPLLAAGDVPRHFTVIEYNPGTRLPSAIARQIAGQVIPIIQTYAKARTAG